MRSDAYNLCLLHGNSSVALAETCKVIVINLVKRLERLKNVQK
jgi:hypothetical protein